MLAAASAALASASLFLAAAASFLNFSSTSTSSARLRPVVPCFNASMRRCVDAYNASMRAIAAAGACAGSVWAAGVSNGSTSPSLRRVSSSSSKEQTRDDDDARSPPVRASTLKLSYLPRGAGRRESRVVAGVGEF